MPRSFVAAMRRINQLMRPARPGKTIRAMQAALTGGKALAAMPGTKAKARKPRKPALAKPGKTLGIVLKQLKFLQALQPSAPLAKPAGKAPVIPEGASFLSATHRSATGSRDYRIYLPASRAQRPVGLIVMLHGCNQTPDDFANGTHMNALAEKHGLAVVYPAQTTRHNAAACWNWFKPAHQARGKGEPALLAALARKVMRDFDLGRDAVFVAGLSAGGAMASILADVYPDIFSAAGIHSGLSRGAAGDVLSALSVMRNGGAALPPPLSGHAKVQPARRIVFHGDNDSTVHPANATAIVATALGPTATAAKMTRRTVRGRSYSRSDFAGPDGAAQLELWIIEGGGHAWSGGRAAGSYTDRSGPDASAQMVRFFLARS